MIERGLPLSSRLPPYPLSAGPALSDPPGTAPLVDSALWVQHALLGTVATSVAIVAIAAIGFLALTGRIELRRGATTVLGCFILFGAPAIASAFVGTFSLSERPGASLPVEIAQPVIAPAPSPPPAVYDPYAGASVERR